MVEHYLETEFRQLFVHRRDVVDFLMSNCIDGCWYWDLQNPEVEWMSREFWLTLGYNPEEKAHRADAWQDIIDQSDLDAALINFNKHCEDPGHPYDQIVRYDGGEGASKWVRCRGVAIRDGDGVPIRMLGIHTDVTEFKRAERALEGKRVELQEMAAVLAAREEELNLIFNSAPARIWLKDDKNNILRANEAAANSMNMSSTELLGANTYDLFPDMAEKYHKDDLAVIQSGNALLGIVESYAPSSGAQGWVSTDKIPIELTNGERRLLVMSVDVTAQKAREAKLESLNQSLRDFASVAAHDLKTPLRQVAMLADTVSDEVDKMSEEISVAGAAALDAIFESIEKMQTTIDSLSELTKLENRTAKLRNYDFTELVSNVLSQVQVVTDEQKADIEIRSLPVCAIDPDLMSRVLQNLILNACKFSGDNSPRLRIWSQKNIPHRHHEIMIEDEGIGVPSDRKDYIFEPFSRLHHQSAIEGSGLGLAICRRIMVAQGGSIALDTNYTDGCRFILRIPF